MKCRHISTGITWDTYPDDLFGRQMMYICSLPQSPFALVEEEV